MPIPKNQRKENYLVESTCINTMLDNGHNNLLSSIEYMKFNIFNKNNSFETSYKIDYELCNSLDYRNIINFNTGKFTRSYIQNRLIPSELADYEEMSKEQKDETISIQNIRLGDGSSIVIDTKLSLNEFPNEDPRIVGSIINENALNTFCELEHLNEALPFFHNDKLRFLDYIELKFYDQADNSYITSVILDAQVCKLY